MNWQEDWDYGPNTTGWNDGRCHGLYGTSVAIIPTAATTALRRFLFAVLALAGLAGGTFQGIQSARIVSRIITSPTDGTSARYQPQRMKHVRSASEGAKAWRHR